MLSATLNLKLWELRYQDVFINLKISRFFIILILLHYSKTLSIFTEANQQT